MNRPRVIGLLLALITLAIYAPVAHYNFVVFDDGGYVYENYHVQNGLTWEGIKWGLTADVVGNWHPLTMLSLMLDCQLFGLNPGEQHLVNVLFHCANSVLLLFLLFRLTNSLWPSALIAALFAWHPLHVESVAWISERKDVLSTFFELLALLAYVRYVKADKRSSFWLSLILFALALLSKPMPVTLPFVLLLLDYWPLRRFADFKLEWATALRLFREKWPFFLLSGGSCVATFIAQHASGAVLALKSYPFELRLENALASYGRYLLMTVWPVHLTIVYPLEGYSTWMRVIAGLMFIVLAIVTWLAWGVRRQFPYLLVGWLWYLGTLVPVIGLVQVGIQALADRYTYFPLIGIFIAATFGIKDLTARFHIGMVPLTAGISSILVACLILTERQLHYWQNSEILFTHAIAVTKNNDTAYHNLGLAYQQQGRWKEAIAEYRKALQINPDRSDTHNNLGTLLDDMGDHDEAREQFQEALRLNPHDVSAKINLGMALVHLDRLDEAIKQYAEASQLDPTVPRVFFQWGRALLFQGHDQEAIPKFSEALRLNPNDFEVLVYLARVLASDEKPKIRNGEIALAMAAKANDLTHDTQPVAFDTIAMAYAELGQFNEAQTAEENAIKLATAYNQKEDVVEMQKCLKLYKSHQPFRQSFLQTHPEMPANSSPMPNAH